MRNLTIILIMLLLTIYFYKYMPEQMAIHWNIDGQPDGYASRQVGVSIIPLTSFLLLLTFEIIPIIDPLRKNISKFKKYYDLLITLLFLLLFYFQMLILLWNIKAFDIIRYMIPSLSIVFYVVSIILEKAKRNWFIGIRTPWTLSSDEVWKKTHELGAKLFKMCAFLSILGMFTRYSIYFVVVPVVISSAILVIYSYLIYRR